MSTHLCITVRWIWDRFHGFIDGTEVLEWPPSPYRLFQSLLAGAHRYGLNAPRNDALMWIERQSTAPDILASQNPQSGAIYDHWVPDNDDLLKHRRGSIRKFCPALFESSPHVHYVWRIDPTDPPPLSAIDDVTSTLSSLGWATDQAYAVVSLVSVQHFDAEILEQLTLSRFVPAIKTTSTSGSLRVPKPGSIHDLEKVYSMNRTAFTGQTERRRKMWPKIFDRVLYTSTERPIGRPRVVFKLVDENDDTVSYPQGKLIHVSGMVRHLAKHRMSNYPPRNLRGLKSAEWVRSYVMGHQSVEDKAANAAHTQFSYVPLQSIGTEHTDPGVRRIMIVAPLGDDAWLEHLAQQLDGEVLTPLPNTTLPPGTRLQRIAVDARDGVRDKYLRPSRKWASVTPVLLDGHIKKKRIKDMGGREIEVTNHAELIAKALGRAGIEQPCEFDWGSFSYFRKSLPAHKYRRDSTDPSKITRTNYIRPDHLLENTGIHVTLRFGRRVDPTDENSSWIPAESPIPGPIAIGAGRHCGFGLFAPV